ncbi:hypothetical protein CH375_21075, partial [Leptospira ellisii]
MNQDRFDSVFNISVQGGLLADSRHGNLIGRNGSSDSPIGGVRGRTTNDFPEEGVAEDAFAAEARGR